MQRNKSQPPHQAAIQRMLHLRASEQLLQLGVGGNRTTLPSTFSSTTTDSLKYPKIPFVRLTAPTQPFCQMLTSNFARTTRTWLWRGVAAVRYGKNL